MIKGNQQKFILTCVMFVLMMMLSISTAFALINQSIIKDFQSEITATNVLFTFNGNTYFDGIGTENLDVFKGEPNDITMTVGVISSGRHTIDYTVNFEFTQESEITKAIEVYTFNGNRYEFLCMLDEIDAYPINGIMTTAVKEDIHLRLVYSGTVSDSFIPAKKTFHIKAKAEATINSSSPLYSFASDEIDFMSIIANENNNGKTIILLKDLTIQDPITTSGKIGIDLNGHELNLENNIIIDCNYLPKSGIGIINSKPTGRVYSLTNNYISVINAVDCYVVDNNIDCNPANGIIRISTLGNLYDSIFLDFNVLLKNRISKLSDGSVYYLGQDVSFLTDDLNYYAQLFNLSLTVDSIIQKNPSSNEFNITSADDLTSKFFFSFILNYNGNYQTINGNLIVRGNSPKAIADFLIDKLPSPIRGSQYLRRYDAVTASYIDWHIDDHFDGNLFDGDGIYKRNGFDAIVDQIDHFGDSTIDVYIKVFKGNETGSSAGNDQGAGYGESYIFYQVDIELASAAELTALLYSNTPAVIFADGDYNIFETELIKKYKDKIDLSGISIEIVEGTDALGYLEVVESETNQGFDIVRINEDVSLNQNTLQYAKIKITFTYGEDNQIKTHTIFKDVTISGEIAEITKYDMSYRLQSAFVGNDYTEGRAFSFYAYGALLPSTQGQSVAVFVEYTVLGEAAKYVSITYEYVRVNFADIENQIAYFVFENGKYVLSETDNPALTYYERKANVEVLPQKINTHEWSIAEIVATLYTLDEYGEPVRNIEGTLLYVDPVTGRSQILTYDLTLAIEGIIHNSDTQITDINLYYVFRQLFDHNGDGIITAREADDWNTAVSRGSMSGLMKSYLSYYSGFVYYIDLSGLSLATLNGVQFFPKIQGFDLRDTGRVDISILQSLSNVIYLNFATATGLNAITNIAPLTYMDWLEYLNLTGNKVSNLEPLRYLPRLRDLRIDSNKVTDFEPLTSITSLSYFSFTGMKTIYDTSFTTDLAVMYYFSLMKINNPSIQFVYTENININTEMQVAAKVMRDLEEINRVKHVLYLPTFCDYVDEFNNLVTYQLYWYTNVTETNLTFSYDAYGYVNYHIESPIYDKKVTLNLTIYTGVGTKTYDFVREFTLTLESAITAGLYIYDTTSPINTPRYIDARIEIPDDILRALLFENFNPLNTDSSISITLRDGTVITTTEKYVISKEDFDYLTLNKLNSYNWTKQGINDLTGIGYFRNIFNSTTSLLLSNNNFDDLTPLLKHTDSLNQTVNGLTNLATLTVGGNYYDFSQLVGLNSLGFLYVYESYDLDSEKALKSLYDLYRSNANLNIYISDTNVAWNPYATILPKKVQNLPTIVAFQRVGEVFDLYHQSAGFEMELYDVGYTFTVTAATIYNKYLGQTAAAGQFIRITTGDTINSGKVSYNSMFVSEDAVYAKITITSTISDGHNKIEYAEYYLQILLSDVSHQIIVHNASGDGEFTQMTLGNLVNSRDLRTIVINRFFTFANVNSSLASLSALLNSSSDSVYFYDQQTGLYHITTNIFKSTGIMNVSFGSFTYNATASTLILYGSYDFGDNALNGLRYFTNIKNLTVNRDARIGSGRELINITDLTINNSLVDLTTIEISLPNLINITISNYYTFKAGYANNSALRMMPNLRSFQIYTGQAVLINETVNMYNIDDLSFILGAVTQNQYGQDITQLTTFRAYGVAKAAVTSIPNANITKRLYQAALNNGISVASIAYRIGSPANTADSGYFHVIQGISWYCTGTNPATASLSWEGATDSEFVRTEAEEYDLLVSKMRDFGLKINNDYWTANKTHTLAVSDSITLPGNTGKDYYGLFYDANAVIFDDDDIIRVYDIRWTVYHILSNGTTTITTLPIGDDIILNAQDYQGYLMIIGTLQNVPAGRTVYSHMYHFSVGAGDGAYSEVDDLYLRTFLLTAEYGTAGPITTTFATPANQTITNATIYSRMGLTVLANNNSSSYVYSVKGFDKVVEQWGMRRSTTGLDKITSISITRPKFSDISALFRFENLTLLNLSSNSTEYGFVKLTGIEGNLLKLQTLQLNYNVLITPYEIEKLLADANRPLTRLEIYRTNSISSFETIEIINQLIQRVGTMSIAINGSAGSNVTAAQCQGFINNMTSVFSDGIDDSMDICFNGKQTITINSVVYEFTMTDYVNRMLKNYRVKENVTVKLRLSSISNIATFNNVFITKTYRKAGITSPLQFGPNGYDIDYFDTELIAYCLSYSATVSYFTENANGYYLLNRNVNINASAATHYSYGISSFANVGLLSSTYNVTFTVGTNYFFALAYSYVAVNINPPNMPALVNSPIYNDATTLNDLTHLNYISNTYSYTINTATSQVIQPVYKATLPSHIYIRGELGRIIWGASSVTNLENPDGTVMTTTNQMVVTIKDGQWVFELSENTVAVRSGSSSGTFVLDYYIQRVDGSGNILAPSTTARRTITISKHEDNYVEIGYDFFVEVDIYNNKAVLYNNLSSKIPQNIYYSLDITPQTIYLFGGKYYLEGFVGAQVRYAVPASAIFESDRLIQMIFVRYYKGASNLIHYRYIAGVDNQAGYIIRLTDIPARSEMNVINYQPESGSFTTNTGITSLEGIQIFLYVDTLRIFGSLITSLEPIRSLRLVYFDYATSIIENTNASDLPKYNNNYTITDFSPLLEGSKDSLMTFAYAGNPSFQLIDMHFVLSFTKLKTIFLGATSYISSNIGMGYFATSAGKYLIGALYDKGAYIYVNTTVASLHNLKYDSSRTARYNNTHNCYALVVSTEYMIAREVLKSYTTDSGFNNPYDNHGITFKDGYILEFNTNGYQLNLSNHTLNFDLNTLIYTGGGFYFIDWYKASSDLTINGYYLQNEITIDGVTYPAGVMLDKETAAIIADSVEYFSQYKSGQNCLKLSVSVKANDLSGLTDIHSRLVCRINYMGCAYERMFTLNFN